MARKLGSRPRKKSIPVTPIDVDVNGQKSTPRKCNSVTSTQTLSEADPQTLDNKALVVQTLRSILTDTTASAAAKASAARTLAEIEGALGRHAAPPASSAKPLTEMTREELEAELAAEGAVI